MISKERLIKEYPRESFVVFNFMLFMSMSMPAYFFVLNHFGVLHGFAYYISITYLFVVIMGYNLDMSIKLTKLGLAK